MKVFPQKTTCTSRKKLISSTMNSDEVARSFRKMVRLLLSCCFPSAEASRKPQRAEEQKLYCSSFLQLTNSRRKITIEMAQTMNMIFRQRIGSIGSDHFMISRLKLHPKRNTGSVKLFAQPTSPESPVKTVNIFHPMVSQVKLPRHQSRRMPSTSEVTSWQMKGAVKSRQNSKCLRCSGRRTSDSSAKVGILRKGGQGTTSETQTMMLMEINTVVRDLSLQQGASRLVIISKKVSACSFSSPRSSCGGVTSTVHAVIFAIFILLIYKLQLLMQCCSDAAIPRQQTWRREVQTQEEPLKFRILSLLGLKEYLIDKYVFLRSDPQYRIVEEEMGKLVFQCENAINYPEEYESEVTLVEDAGHSMPAVMLSLKERASYCGTVVYSHGNSSDLLNSLSFISKFAKQFPKFDYLVYDYTGYGQSKKTNITESTICEDLELLISSIRVPDDEIILWGFSLGTFPTVKVASKRNFKGVILQSPLASVYSLFTEELTPYSSFSNDCFNLVDHISDINSFLVIIHSKQDEVIPFTHSKALFEKYQMTNSNPFCFLLEVTGLKHNQMQGLLCDRDKNEIRQSLHAYLRLMIEQKSLPTTRMFQLTKNKYFDNLGEFSGAEHIDTTDKKTNETPRQFNLTLTDSFNFTDIKRERNFEIDEITSEAAVEMNYYMQVKTDRHSLYFEASQAARNQVKSEAPSQIRSEIKSSARSEAISSREAREARSPREETEFQTILHEDHIPDIYE